MSLVPDSLLTAVLGAIPPGRALDLACGGGRHTRWLLDRGWQVTAIDIAPTPVEGAAMLQMDLETGPNPIAPGSWDLIVSWLYYQPSLFPAVKAGVRRGGVIALAGKTTGRFATSLSEFRACFQEGFSELAAGEESGRAWFIARYNE